MTIRLRNVCIIFGITVVVYLGMKYLLPLVIPFVFAWLIVMALNPLVEKIHSKVKLNKGFLASVILGVIVVLLFFILRFILIKAVDQVRQLVSNWDYYIGEAELMVENICGIIEMALGWKSEHTKIFLNDSLAGLVDYIKENILAKAVNVSASYIGSFMKLITSVVITFISVVLLQKDYNKIRNVGRENFYYNKIRRVCQGLCSSGGTYLRAQLIIMCIIAGIITVGLFLTGNPYALLLGAGIGVMDAMPVLGTGTVFIPWIIIKLIKGEFGYALVYAVIWGITCLAREFLEPKLVGKKLGIYPIVILMTVYIGIYLFGVAGILLGPLSLLIIIEISKEAGLL